MFEESALLSARWGCTPRSEPKKSHHSNHSHLPPPHLKIPTQLLCVDWVPFVCSTTWKWVWDTSDPGLTLTCEVDIKANRPLRAAGWVNRMREWTNEGTDSSTPTDSHFSLKTLDSWRRLLFWGLAQERLVRGSPTACSPQHASPQEPKGCSIPLTSSWPTSHPPRGCRPQGRRDWAKGEEAFRGQLRTGARRRGSGVPLRQIQVYWAGSFYNLGGPFKQRKTWYRWWILI